MANGEHVDGPGLKHSPLAKVPVLCFGPPFDSPRFDPGGGCVRVDVATPAGTPCLQCDEQVQDGDRGEMTTLFRSATETPEVHPVHTECQLLDMIGHSFGVCSCTGYGGKSTRRQAALLLLEKINDGRARSGWGPM